MMYEFRIRAKDMPSLNKMIVDAAEAIKNGEKATVYNETPAVSQVAVPTVGATPSPLPNFAPPIDTASLPTTADVDSSGAPWNPNIHASSKTKKKDGTWKLRKGGPAEVDTDEAPEAANVLPMIPPAFTAPSIPMPVPELPKVDGVYNFATFKANFVLITSNLINQGKFARSYLKQLEQYFGVSSIDQISGDDGKIRQLMNVYAQAQYITVLE